MKKNKYLIVLLGILLVLFTPEKSRAYDATLSVGNLCEYVGKIQVDENGGTNFCEFNPYFASSIDYSVSPEFLIAPEFGFSIPKSARDENISKMSLFILANAKYKLTNFHLIVGLGLFFTRISGSGGTEDLNNGNSTSSFPLPDSSVFTRNFILNLGAGLDFTREWSADLHTYIFNLTSSEDRAYSIAINGTYHFGEF